MGISMLKRYSRTAEGTDKQKEYKMHEERYTQGQGCMLFNIMFC